MLFSHPALAHQPMLSTFHSRHLTPKHLKNLRTSVRAMLEVNCNNTSSTSPFSPTISSCPTATAGSDQLKVPSIAMSNSLFLEDLASLHQYFVLQMMAVACILQLSEQKSRIFAHVKLLFQQCPGDMNRNLPASLF